MAQDLFVASMIFLCTSSSVLLFLYVCVCTHLRVCPSPSCPSGVRHWCRIYPEVQVPGIEPETFSVLG